MSAAASLASGWCICLLNNASTRSRTLGGAGLADCSSINFRDGSSCEIGYRNRSPGNSESAAEQR
ncbi:hypothetical protein HNQ59_001664 [Chitinivorax tropicus]|uniref:Uncharacterized protein n=1 Tax=Chitinivorax tropicus TaxID=714531 RepID=A0A840MPG0_9PROT|nr:hypothetical protein [Chitinivorax tropicus]